MDLDTLHGYTARNFPNMFWPGPGQGINTANQTWVLETMIGHIVQAI
jgi:hypothetical protein